MLRTCKHMLNFLPSVTLHSKRFAACNLQSLIGQCMLRAPPARKAVPLPPWAGRQEPIHGSQERKGMSGAACKQHPVVRKSRSLSRPIKKPDECQPASAAAVPAPTEQATVRTFWRWTRQTEWQDLGFRMNYPKPLP